MTRASVRPIRPALIAALLGAAAACGPTSDAGAAASRPTPPAAVAAPLTDDALGRVVLTEEAERRLALATAKVETGAHAPSRLYAGVFEIPPGRTATLVAPTAGNVFAWGAAPTVGGRLAAAAAVFGVEPFIAPDRAWIGPTEELRFAEFDAARRARTADALAAEAVAVADVEGARAAAVRAEASRIAGSGTARAAAEAAEALKSAEARRDAAASRRTALEVPYVAPTRGTLLPEVAAPFAGRIAALHAVVGQHVAAGAPLATIVADDVLRVRVAVPDGDVAALDVAAAAALVDPARPDAPGVPLVRAAEPVAGRAGDGATIFAFDVPNPDAALPVGGRATVRLRRRGGVDALFVPRAAVLYDVHGGASVFVAAGAHAYARRRVEIADVAGDRLVVARGLKAGETVVTAGAAELWGTAFGFGK